MEKISIRLVITERRIELKLDRINYVAPALCITMHFCETPYPYITYSMEVCEYMDKFEWKGEIKYF